MSRRGEVLAGSLLGTAVGDSVGLPREGLSRRRAQRWYGDRPLQHAFLGRRGMLSDDTEHTCMVAQALLAAPGDSAGFSRSLGWRLRGWLLALPAGIGFGTLRALLKLWVGFSPARSGVFTAGNGPAMRAPLIGACLGDTPLMREVLAVSTRVTHTDPKAYEGALLAALAAHLGGQAEGLLQAGPTLDAFRAEVEGEELLAALDLVGEHLRRGSEPAEFADALDQEKGISGYVNHTLPAVLFCWLRTPHDYALALEAVVRLGGDADTTGAILGGIAGASVGASGLPEPWLNGIADWPRSVSWMRQLATRLEACYPHPGQPAIESPGPQPLFWPVLPLRNLGFLSVVLAHGFRRLLPPY